MMILSRGKTGRAQQLFTRYAVTFLLMGSLTAAFSSPLLSPRPLAAQDRVPPQRVVHGRVENKSGAGIEGAVVYLKDSRSSSVKSAITIKDGTYRFVQLSANTDYELWAQVEQKKSPTKTISSFDNKNDITITLKIDE